MIETGQAIQTEGNTKLLEACYAHTKTCCGTLFSDQFYAPFSLLHNQIFDLIDSGANKIAIAAPRGIGKTTICRAFVSKMLLFRMANFMLYISNSATSAEMQTENIKRELLSNKLIRQFFGSIKIHDSGFDDVDETFSKKAWVAFGNSFMLPRGAGQQVRGLNWASYRPQVVIIDDLEVKLELENEENRRKLKEWFFSDLMKTEDKYGKPCTFIYIDTIKHEDSLLSNLMEASDWETLQLAICDADYNSLDPAYMTTEEIKAEVEEHREKGLMDLFYMERMNIPISTEDAVFKSEYFKYFQDQGDQLVVMEDGKNSVISTHNLIHVVIVDPAKTVKLHSAESAVVCIAIDRVSKKILVRDVVSEKYMPDQLYDAMFDMVQRYDARILAVEVTSLHAFISQPIENEMRTRGIYPYYLELNAIGKKAERVATLAPHYRLGHMYHNRDTCGKLESQLIWFPKSKFWDVMDAAAYITKVMDDLSYYFDPPGDESDDPEEEFDELDNDDALIHMGIV